MINWIVENKEWVFSGIGVVIVVSLLGILKKFSTKFLKKGRRYESISDAASLPLKEVKKRVKIVVIDDEEESFPWKLLQESEYNIEWWPNVGHQELEQLENREFDIIILDIQGIADEQLSPNDGLGILEHLKKVNPNQIVIAFSGHSYDLDKVPFWKMADDSLKKPVNIIKCKEVLDKLIEERIRIKYYWEEIVALLNQEEVPKNAPKELQHEIAVALQNNSELDIRKIKSDILKGARKMGKVMNLTNAIMRIWGYERT